MWITHFEDIVSVIHDDVVRLQIRMDDPELLHMAQCNEELTSICPDSIDLDAAPVAKLLHGGPKVLVERLEDHAQVVFVIKATEKPNAVLPILGVGFAQSCERGDFLLASSAHHLVVALHLDRHHIRLSGLRSQVFTLDDR